MAMNWIKGLVAPAAEFGGQQGAQQQPMQGGPPVGGMPSPYGVQQAPPMQQAMPFAPPPQASPVPGAMEWSVGTRTQGSAAGSISGNAPAQNLQHDVESLALFARTLLTLLEEKKVVTRTEFEEMKKRLDLLDGKLDDR